MFKVFEDRSKCIEFNVSILFIIQKQITHDYNFASDILSHCTLKYNPLLNCLVL